MSEAMATWIDWVVEEAGDDYVGMTALASILRTDETPRDSPLLAERVAHVLDALLEDRRVVVVDGYDVATPVSKGIGDRYLAAFREQGRVMDGEVAWVMDRATWEKENGVPVTHTCPVCRFDGLSQQPWKADSPSDDICPGCGTQFGYDDMRRAASEREARWAELRAAWIAAGRPWTSRSDPRPEDWPPAGTTLDA